jgi:hypothetical protein
MLDPVLEGLILLLLLLLPGGIVLHARFLRALRQRYPRVWESLGRPTMIRNNTIRNSRAAQRFLRRREYETLEDPDLSALCDILRVYTRAYTVLLWAFLLCLVAVWIKARVG